jgi:hypothetical protein
VFSQKKFKFCVQAYSPPPSRPYCLDPFTSSPLLSPATSSKRARSRPDLLAPDICSMFKSQ